MDRDSYDYSLDLEAMANTPNYASWIVERFKPYLHGTAVEIGPGLGTLSARILPHVARMDLVEPAAAMADILNAQFGTRDNVRIFAEDFEAFFAHAEVGRYDAIIMINVLEHIEDDDAVLLKARELLGPGGKLLIYVPAMPILYSALDRAIGHFRRYTGDRLRKILRTAGYSIVLLRYMDILGALPWFVINTMVGARRIDGRMASLYDRVGIPLTRAVESLFKPSFGKNLIVVAAKDDVRP